MSLVTLGMIIFIISQVFINLVTMKLYLCSSLLWPILASGLRVHRISENGPVHDTLILPRDQLPQANPNSEITLTYDSYGETYATVNISTNQPAVALKDVEGISNVRCDDSAIHMTFDSPRFLNYGKSWAGHPALILVTNHLGNCDANGEPGFYIANNLQQNAASQMLTASVEKKNLADIACTYIRDIHQASTNISATASVRASFTGRRLDQGANLTFSNPSIWDVSYTNAPGQVFADDLSLVGTTGQGYFYTSLSYSGYLEYEPGRPLTSPLLRSLYLDITLTSDHALPLVLNATVPYKGRAAVQVGYLQSNTWGIPGILDVLPSLTFETGADVDAPTPEVAQTNLSALLSDGRARLDLADPNMTSSGGMWDGNYGSGVAIEPAGPVRVAPFLAVTAAFDVNVTGLADNNRFFQAVRGASRSAYDFQVIPGGVCSRTSYGYTIEAWNLDAWHRTLLDRQDPYSNNCQ